MEDFQELTEKIFRQTYGFPSENLSGEELDKVRDAVIELRKSYASNVCTPLYHREEIRKAYMFAYYPYYIQPVYEVVTRILRFKKMSPALEHNPINITYLAGGPCPELYGTIKALKEIGLDNDIDAQIYDIEEGWRNLQNITLDLCKDCYGKNISLKFFSGYDALNVENQNLNLGTENILFMQNYLSHVRDVDEFLESFKNILAQNISTIIILDLNYDATAFILDKICSSYFKRKNNLSTVEKHIPYEYSPLVEEHPNPSAGIKKIFTYEIDGITYPKKYTKYYYAVLRKK